jgi:predicted permease
MSDWLRDVRQGVRGLGRQPGMLAVAILSIGLGIGVSTGVLAVARAVLLKPLPVADPGELRVLHWSAAEVVRGVNQINAYNTRDAATGRSLSSNFSYPAFETLRAAATGRAEVFGFTALRTNISLSLPSGKIEGHPALGGAMLVSGDFFSGLRVPMAFGRGITPQDDQEGADPVAVLGYGLWQRTFGSDPAALGRAIRINGQPFTIVGVTGPDYFGVSNGGFFPPADVTVSLHAQPLAAARWTPDNGSLFRSESTFWVRVMARVPPSVDDGAFRDAMTVAFSRHTSAGVTMIRAPDVVLLPGARGLDSLRTRFEKPLSILGGVAALVFVIACVNVSGLLLVRGVARQREYWIRQALGAGRGRLLRQAFVESAIIAGAGGVLGLLMAVWAASSLATMLAGPQPNALAISLDLPLLGIATLVAGGATVLFGLVPARRLARSATAPEFLRLGGAGSDGPRLRAGRVLVAVQVAVSVPLVIGAVLFLRTVNNLARVELGFEATDLVIFRLDPTLNGYDAARSRRLMEQVLTRVEAVPGVRAATLVENALISGFVSNTPMTVDAAEPKQILVNRVGPGFFETLGMPLSAGRGISWQDRAGAPRVGVINEAAVRLFFDGQPPLGREVRMRGFLKPDPVQIVGVARDSRYASLKGQTRPTIYLPFLQSTDLRAAIVAVRTAGTPAMFEQLRAAVADIDRDVPVTDLKTQQAQINETISSERMFTTLLVCFGGFALLLACLGVHGITAYAVARRTSEIGVRVALGARRSDVVWLVLRQVVIVAAIGVSVGVAAAALTARTVRALLFGVEPADPWSLATGAVVMFSVAVAAGLLPARRAARLDPLVALRRE